MALVIFDLDNTLIAGDSDYLWGEFLVERELVDVDAYKQKNDYFYEQYEQSKLDIYEYTDFVTEPLKANSMETLNKLHQEFMQEKIQPIMLPQAAELIQKHKDQGDQLLIITATNSFITKPIGDALEIDELLGIDLEVIDGRFTGKIVGTPSFQEGKVTRLNEWLADKNISLEGAYFYSDSINDLPLLEKVDNPVVVDGDEKLTAIAKERDWKQISLRN